MQADYQRNSKSSKEGIEDSQGDYSWSNIGTNGILMQSFIGRIGDVYSVSGGLTPNQIWRYKGADSKWNQLSGAAKSIGVTSEMVYAISNIGNGQTIWENNPSEDSFNPIPILDTSKPHYPPYPPAEQLISGGNQIYYIHDLHGLVYKYQNTPNDWNLLDLTLLSYSPYSKYVASGDHLIGLRETKIYTFINDIWTNISGAEGDTSSFIDIVGGDSGEFYGVSNSHLLYVWGGSVGVWNPIIGLQEINLFSPQYISNPTGLLGFVFGTDDPSKRGIYKHSENNWNKIDASLPSKSPLALQNGSGYLALQPILADSSDCYLLNSS